MAEQKRKSRGKAELIPVTCIGCGRCQSVCPVDAITYDDKGEPVIDHDKCIGCGKCVKICPVAALKMAYPEGESVVVESTPVGAEEPAEGRASEKWKGVWVFVEQRDGRPHPVSWQLLGVGSRLATDLGEELSAVILGAGTGHLVREAFAYGAAKCRM